MLTSKDPYIIIDATNAFALNDAHRNGYELITVIYEDCVETKVVHEKEPLPIYSSSNGSSYGGNYNNYGQPPYRQVDKEQIIVTKLPKAIMKLNKTAEVIYGKDT